MYDACIGLGSLACESTDYASIILGIIGSYVAALCWHNYNAKQKHPGCKKVQGQL